MIWLDIWRKNVKAGSIKEISRELNALAFPRELADSSRLVVAPPHTLLLRLRKSVANPRVSIAAQGSAPFESGAYTGEVSPVQIADGGIAYSLVPLLLERLTGDPGIESGAKRIALLVKHRVRPIILLRISRDVSESWGSAIGKVMVCLNILMTRCAAVSEMLNDEIVVLSFEAQPLGVGVRDRQAIVSAAREAVERVMPKQASGDPVCSILLQAPPNMNHLVSAISTCQADGLMTYDVLTGYGNILSSLVAAVS